MPLFSTIIWLPPVSSVPLGEKVAIGLRCSIANRKAFIAPPFVDDWATSAPSAKPTIVLFLLRRVNVAAAVPNGNSLSSVAP